MIRRIIQIDEEKCNGCGACAEACHEGAIGMVNGKATLLRDDYCDGLGDCLPTCPTGAISFVEREAAAYDEKAVQENMRKKAKSNHAAVPHTGCPGSRMQRIQHSQETTPSARVQTESQLGQWPCQIKLVPTNALYFDGAKLLIAADCSAYAYARMHEDFMRGKITIIGCPKLDSIDYSEKLTQIIQNNNIQSVTVVRMEVPCCGGLELAAKKRCRQAENSFLGRLLRFRWMVKFWNKRRDTMSKKMKNIAQSEVLTLREQISYQEGQVVSKTLTQNQAVSITLFSFAKGEEISTHESGGDAFVTCLDGIGKITIDGVEYLLHEGESIVMPAGHPHAVYGQEAFKMLLVVVF